MPDDCTTAQDPVGPQHRRPRRPGHRPGLPSLLLLAALWWSLASPRADALLAGGVAVLGGALLHLGLGGRSRFRVRPGAIPGFVPFFLGQMVRGGLDVGRRALHPALPMDPDLILYRTILPEGLPRTFFVNSISLLPGTFSARLRGDRITVHRLDPDIAPEDVLRNLEGRVTALFGLDAGSEAP